MSNKQTRHRHRLVRRTQPGAAPGTIIVDPAAPKPVITVLAYGSSDGQHALGLQQTLALDKVQADVYAAATAVPNAADAAIAAQYYNHQITAYQANAAEVQYDPHDTVYFTYCYAHPVAARIKPGDTVVTKTRDASNDAFSPSDKTMMALRPC